MPLKYNRNLCEITDMSSNERFRSGVEGRRDKIQKENSDVARSSFECKKGGDGRLKAILR